MKRDDLTIGELNLMVRALRYYANAEQRAVQDAWTRAKFARKAKQEYEQGQAEKMQRECSEHIAAAQALMRKLRPDFSQPLRDAVPARHRRLDPGGTV